jgi:hypothetical protein
LGIELKKKFCSLNELNYEQYKIRLLCKGHEILDDHRLYYHEFNNLNNKVQVTYQIKSEMILVSQKSNKNEENNK